MKKHCIKLGKCLQIVYELRHSYLEYIKDFNNNKNTKNTVKKLFVGKGSEYTNDK